MAGQVKPIPDKFNTVSAYLVVPNCVEALEFYTRAFGAETVYRMPGPDGRTTVHAEMRIGDSTIMLMDENPQWQKKSALTMGGSPVSLHLYVNDADASFRRATQAGCKIEMPLQDMFWGDRYGKVADPFGLTWGIATHKEDVSEAELKKRAAAFFASMAKGG
jgi:uncharacterized glyoxalase superfamily protein PhnB